MRDGWIGGAALMAAAGAAAGGIITITDLPLDGQQVIPPVPDAGSGLATVTFDTATRAVTITGTYTGMSSLVTAAHLHGPAGPGEDSPLIIFPLAHDGGTAGGFSGGRTLSQTQFDALMDSRTYINVHTQNHPAGEIRGQVFVPGGPTAGVLAAAGAWGARRRRAG